MKYIVVLGDGWADYPCSELGGKTPLQAANKPAIDKLACSSEVGLVQTIPKGMKPGSDNANLSVMGYDPLTCYTGRSPLEAISMGISLEDGDVTYRCNLVNLSEENDYLDKTMIDYSSDEISTEEARELIKYLSEHFDTDNLKLFSGISYRHCLKWQGGKIGKMKLIPPHDISDKKIADYLPKGEGSEVLLDLMKQSAILLKNHPVNLERVRKGKRPANSCWFWGEGTKPSLEDYGKKFGVKGAVISAVDLIKGIGICANLSVIEVEGATGNINTNFKGKAQAAINALENGYDFVYVHLEAPDECGHRGEAINKVKAIEYIDSKIVAPIVEHFNKSNQPYSMMILPDHATPLSTRTHISDPVPYLIYRSNKIEKSKVSCYDEESGKESGIFVEKGYTLMQRFLKN